MPPKSAKKSLVFFIYEWVSFLDYSDSLDFCDCLFSKPAKKSLVFPRAELLCASVKGSAPPTGAKFDKLNPEFYFSVDFLGSVGPKGLELSPEASGNCEKFNPGSDYLSIFMVKATLSLGGGSLFFAF